MTKLFRFRLIDKNGSPSALSQAFNSFEEAYKAAHELETNSLLIEIIRTR